MFRRRLKLSYTKRLANLLWPRSGLRRSVQYLRHRLGRMQGSPYAIAAGFAYGAAISFTPLMGGHIAFAALLSWVSRASVVASVIGTVVGNPWTFPFIWAWIYYLGVWLLGIDPIDFNAEKLSWNFLLDHFLDIFLPMLAGGIPSGAVVWLAFYFPIKVSVERYQVARLVRMIEARQRKPLKTDEGTRI
ncbi:MAG: DUF2062 domain-containing protein [Alphaproteobacteria bacterium]